MQSRSAIVSESNGSQPSVIRVLHATRATTGCASIRRSADTIPQVSLLGWCSRALVCGKGLLISPGTFQQYVLGPASYVTPIPESLPSDAAAPMLCAGVTVYSALKKSGAQAGDWIAILGAGGTTLALRKPALTHRLTRFCRRSWTSCNADSRARHGNSCRGY